jgi:hypothetical protein
MMPPLDGFSVLVGAAGMAAVWGMVTLWAMCVGVGDVEHRSLPPERDEEGEPERAIAPCVDLSTWRDRRYGGGINSGGEW